MYLQSRYIHRCRTRNKKYTKNTTYTNVGVCCIFSLFFITRPAPVDTSVLQPLYVYWLIVVQRPANNFFSRIQEESKIVIEDGYRRKQGYFVITDAKFNCSGKSDREFKPVQLATCNRTLNPSCCK